MWLPYICLDETYKTRRLSNDSPDDKWWDKAWWPEVTVIKQERVILESNKNWRKSCCARHYRDVSTVPESLGTTASESFRTIGARPPHVSWKAECGTWINAGEVSFSHLPVRFILEVIQQLRRNIVSSNNLGKAIYSCIWLGWMRISSTNPQKMQRFLPFLYPHYIALCMHVINYDPVERLQPYSFH